MLKRVRLTLDRPCENSADQDLFGIQRWESVALPKDTVLEHFSAVRRRERARKHGRGEVLVVRVFDAFEKLCPPAVSARVGPTKVRESKRQTHQFVYFVIDATSREQGCPERCRASVSEFCE